ncbi:MAG: TonB-dependent receptor [Rikenellaceae bacterium]|nr:TonB-dependent receptor [Rikenellaceae bacterium]
MKNFIYNICLSLAAIFMTLSAMAQQTVSGTVVDEAGQPIIGATVIVKGSVQGTTTGIDGKFHLVAPAGSTLTISYLGYISQDVRNLNNPKVVMKEDHQNIEEVVVVGYGTQKKATLTGSVATVDVDDIQDIVAGDLGATLQGLMPGVSVSGGNAQPGERSTIYVRDASSLGALTTSGQSGTQVFSQEPLYVIDGYAYPNDIVVGNETQNYGAEVFSNLDPTMIESISVLKDASAAIYGARAANGVILVTTKKGKQGAPQISYSGSVGIADQSAPKMLNAYDYGRLYNIMRTADDQSISTNMNNTTDLFQLDELAAMKKLNYNLLDEYWETAVKQKHSLNITGATEKANYFAGISYFNQDGNLGNYMDERWNYRAGVDVRVNKWLKAGLSITGDYGKQQKPNIKVAGSSAMNDYNKLLMHPRYIPETVNGMPIATYGVSNEKKDNDQLYSYGLLQEQGDKTNTMTSNMSIQGNLSVDFGEMWAPLQGLQARMSYGKSISTSKTNQATSRFAIYEMVERFGTGQHLYTPTASTSQEDYDRLMALENFNKLDLANSNGGNGSASLLRDMSRADNYQLNFQVNYNRTFGRHTVGAMFNIEKSEAEAEWSRASVGDPYSFTTGSSTTATGTQAAEFKGSESGSLSYLGRINYSYDDKYLLEALVRIDSSTKFAPENYWGYFPSVSAGWVISKEGWFADNVMWVDFLKLRASFGLTGRDNCAAWQWMQSYSATGTEDGPVFGVGTTNQTSSHLSWSKQMAAMNRDVHWDKSYKMNIGLDFNLLNNRLGFVIEGYKEWNREMLMILSQEVPHTVGTESAAVNLGEMNSWGLEFSANWNDRIGKDFKYKIGIQTGYGDNKVLVADFETSADKYYKSMKEGGRTDVGTWGMQCIGMFRSYQDINEYVSKYNITSYMGMAVEDIRPGMLIYKDVRGEAFDEATMTYAGPDGKVSDEYDQVRLSNRSNPYGLTANLGAEWKGLSLNAQISASWGGYSFVPSAALQSKNIEVYSMPSFWNPDDIFTYQDIYDVNGELLVAENRNGSMPNPEFSSVNARQSTFWRISGTRVALRRLTLAYSLPKKWLQPIGISSVRVNVTGTNLLDFYNPYPDNFMSTLAGSYGNYPNLRNWTIGINVSF